MEDPSNIRNCLIAKYIDYDHRDTHQCKSNDSVSSLSSYVDMDGLGASAFQRADKSNALLSYSPNKLSFEAVIPGGSFDFIAPSCYETQELSNAQSNDGSFHNISSYSIWQKLRSSAVKKVNTNNHSYWSRGRRTLKETANFFKNLPQFNPELDAQIIPINHEISVIDNSERIINEVLSKPYGSPFAHESDSNVSLVNDNYDKAPKTSDDSLRSLISLIELDDEDDERLDFVANSSRVSNHKHDQTAMFDGQNCSLIDPVSSDKIAEEIFTEAKVVRASPFAKSLHQRSAYRSYGANSTTKSKAVVNKVKSANWGNNLYVQLCADNAPPSSSQDSSFSKVASKALAEVSQALASLLGFTAMQELSDNVLSKEEIGSFTLALQKRPNSHVSTIIDHSFVLGHKNPLYLNDGQWGAAPLATCFMSNVAITIQDNMSLAMDLLNNKDQDVSHVTSGSSHETHEHSIKAFSGKNNLNTMASDQGLSRVSESERRLERSICSYFIPNEFKDHCVLKNKKEVQAVDVLAYGIFKQWMRRRASILRPDGKLEEANESTLYDTVLVLVQTMIFAMRADGRIESDEHQSLLDFCCSVTPKNLYDNIRGEIDRLLTIDLDPSLLAQKVRYPEESLDIYLLSAVLLNNSHFLELGYLENLAACLGIDPSLRRNLDDSAHKLILNYPKISQH